ncbi:hypothetical protein G6F66_014592 [Rhizopus arrhizus]|nr:hypothetical protein G6F66_014592 [Rhizopus arrhizus]
MRLVARACCVPCRRLAATEVGLCAVARITGLAVGRDIALAAGTSGRRRHAGLAAPVVQRPQHQRPVDVTVQEADQHFLADPRQELAADARSSVALRQIGSASCWGRV